MGAENKEHRSSKETSEDEKMPIFLKLNRHIEIRPQREYRSDGATSRILQLLSALLVGLYGAVSPAASAVEQSKADRLNDLTRIYETRQFKHAKWPNFTNENKLELMKIAALTRVSTDSAARMANRIVEREKKDIFVCAEHGRIDPEIAIEIVKTALMTNAQVDDIADEFKEYCGTGEASRLGWLSDENCIEILKMSKLKGIDFEETLQSVKRIRGYGLMPGIDGTSSTELTKAALAYNQDPEVVYKMFRDAYGNSALDRSWKLSPEASVSLVKAALISKQKDMTSTIAAFKELHGKIGWDGSGYFFAEMVKLGAGTGLSPKSLEKLAQRHYGWGVHDLRYGLSKDVIADLETLAFYDQDNVRKSLVLDHKFMSQRIDRDNCEARKKAATESTQVRTEASAPATKPQQEKSSVQ